MLGIGMQEMMIIALAALLIFGPGKLPEVMGQAGKLYKDFRNMTGELTGEFEKTVAEAKEMGEQITGELGPMQKQVESITNSAKRDLNMGAKSATSSSKKGTTTSKGTAKSGSSGSKAKSSTSTSRTSSKKSTSSKSSTSSRTSSTAKKPAAAPVATKDDPDSDISMFAPEAPVRARRSRRAIPSIISDPTPREADGQFEEVAAASAPSVSPVDSALARARQRRQSAGYAQRSA